MLLDELYKVAEEKGYEVTIFDDSSCVNVSNGYAFCLTSNDKTFEENVCSCLKFLKGE